MQTIFDFGFHEGADTDFYLRKGFRVVAIEANPTFVQRGRARFAAALAAGHLVLVDRALAAEPDTTVGFYCRADKSGWSSLSREAAERDGIASERVEVLTITVGRLFGEYGVPHYLKCDIEGAEDLALMQLAQEHKRPRFVSFEAGPRIIELLVRAGYSRFQIVNQGHLRLFQPPRPPREGRFVDQTFDGTMSGLFGEELEPGEWVGEAEIRSRYAQWLRLAAGQGNPIRRFVLKKIGKWRRKTWLIPGGWLDIHARLDAR